MDGRAVVNFMAAWVLGETIDQRRQGEGIRTICRDPNGGSITVRIEETRVHTWNTQ